jgi:hypothetical protein
MLQTIDRARATIKVACDLFTETEIWRLLYLEATLAAEQCLVPIDEPCPDHLACRRLAFGLWLRSPVVSQRQSTPEPPEGATESAPDSNKRSNRAAPRLMTRFDLRCLLCARIVGSVLANGRGLAGPFIFKTDPNARGIQLADWRQLLCSTCGGNVYPDDAMTVRVYPRVQWDDDQPRRGRPPNWLVAARNAEAPSGE